MYRLSERELETAEMHTHTHTDDGTVIQWKLSVFLPCSLPSGDEYRANSKHRIVFSLRFSTFASLVQGHLKASKHPHFSTFASILYLRLFSISQPRALWHNARDQSNVTSSSYLLGSSLVSTHLCWLYNIPNDHANSRGHSSSLPPTQYTWTLLLRVCHPFNLHSTSTGE